MQAKCAPLTTTFQNTKMQNRLLAGLTQMDVVYESFKRLLKTCFSIEPAMHCDYLVKLLLSKFSDLLSFFLQPTYFLDLLQVRPGPQMGNAMQQVSTGWMSSINAPNNTVACTLNTPTNSFVNSITQAKSTYPIKLIISYSSCGVRGTNYTKSHPNKSVSKLHSSGIT